MARECVETDVKWLYAVTAVRGQVQNCHIVVSCHFDEGRFVSVCFITGLSRLEFTCRMKCSNHFTNSSLCIHHEARQWLQEEHCPSVHPLPVFEHEATKPLFATLFLFAIEH